MLRRLGLLLVLISAPALSASGQSPAKAPEEAGAIIIETEHPDQSRVKVALYVSGSASGRIQPEGSP